jgi:hypothetical protein
LTENAELIASGSFLQEDHSFTIQAGVSAPGNVALAMVTVPFRIFPEELKAFAAFKVTYASICPQCLEHLWRNFLRNGSEQDVSDEDLCSFYL